MNIPPELCARCKGYKRLCGLPRCPILEAFQAQVKVYMKLKDLNASGSTPPSILVGEAGYPKVGVYYMIPVDVHGENAKIYEDPISWAERRVAIAEILRYRSELLSARLETPVVKPEVLYEKEIGLAGISEKPVDSEAELEKIPVPNLRFDGVTKPLGPRAPAKSIRVSENPRINPAVERIIWDDLKVFEATKTLYNSGVDIYAIQKLLSLGFLGKIERRKLVPTRWSITAVDDTISKLLREKLRGKPEVSDTRVYYEEYLGNRFLVIVKPGPGAFEWIEVWQPRSFWIRGAEEPVVWRVYENPLGETSSMDGGFSAARLAVLERLGELGRKADVIIVREITPAYYAPLGNWHIRETMRRAVKKEAETVNPSMKELLDVLEKRINYDPRRLMGMIRLLKKKTTLDNYMI